MKSSKAKLEEKVRIETLKNIDERREKLESCQKRFGGLAFSTHFEGVDEDQKYAYITFFSNETGMSFVIKIPKTLEKNEVGEKIIKETFEKEGFSFLTNEELTKKFNSRNN